MMFAQNIRGTPRGGTTCTPRTSASKGSTSPAAADMRSQASASRSSGTSPRKFSVTWRLRRSTQLIFEAGSMIVRSTSARRSRIASSRSNAMKVRTRYTWHVG